MEQLTIARPFGVEHVRATCDFDPGWGWRWEVTERVGHEWSTLESGMARSPREALRRMADALSVVAELPPEDLYGGF